jgi:ubiquinone biosynthesis accessory factor UbiK
MEKPQDVIDSILEIGRKAMPTGMADAIKDNSLALMKGKLEELDVVSREEFDIQSGVLVKTRAKLEILEARLAALEESLTK